MQITDGQSWQQIDPELDHYWLAAVIFRVPPDRCYLN